jgi:WD40 repeat protein
MFSDQQEVDLGDAQAEGLRQTLTIISDPALTTYLTNIVHRLSQDLPPSRLQFRVALVEERRADAFSIAGGRIYISRKLAALMQNEDEMAGVLAHEMAHVIAHHEAIRMTEALHRTLGVSQVSNREDVFAKWNEYLDNYRRQHPSMSDYLKAWKVEQREQLDADNIALYLLARAGYSTKAYADAFDRISGSEGDTGNFWSDLFGATPPDSKRLRQLLQATPTLPEQCVTHHEISEPSFTAWRNSIIEYSRSDREESLAGLITKRVLTERLRPEIRHVLISSDGKFVLAQDENNIFVLTRAPFKFVFAIDAPQARAAQFTPDSQGIVFDFTSYGGSPRVERWDIPTQRRIEVHEIYVRDGCEQTSVSPDGKFLGCVSYGGALQQLFGIPLLLRRQSVLILFDTSTGAAIWEKKSVEAPPSFSPDGHYLLVHYSGNNFCMDLTTRKEVRLPGGIAELLDSDRFAFVGNGRLIAATSFLSSQAELVEFPSGRYISKGIGVGRSHFSGVAQGDYILVAPIKDNPVGLLDLKQNKIVLGSKRTALDVFDNKYIAEGTDGDLQIFDLATAKGGEQVELPDASLGYVRNAAVSADLSYLAVSQRSRGAVWNLQTGQRLYHVRSFQGAYFSSDGALFADFPKEDEIDRSIAKLSLGATDIEPMHSFDKAERTREVGRYLLTLVTPSQTHSSPPGASGHSSVGIGSASRMEVRDVTNQSLLWTKDFVAGLGAYWVSADTNTLVLCWPANSNSFDAITKQDSELASRIARYPSREGIDWMQVFDLDTGKAKGNVFIDTGKGSFSPIQVQATSNSLIVSDNKKRVLLYSMSGQIEGTIAGHSPVVSLPSQLITVLTEGRALELYELPSLKRRSVYEFNSPVSLSDFSEDGKRLLVLTSDQTVYTLDVRNPPY